LPWLPPLSLTPSILLVIQISKPVTGYDADAKTVVQWLMSHPQCNGRIGTVGVCLGGHLAYRCAFEKEVIAGMCGMMNSSAVLVMG
jgi:dienelactone hydrolase